MLLISSSDGFCSCLTFNPGELGTTWQAPSHTARHSITQLTSAASPGAGTPSQTPTHSIASAIPRPPSSQSQGPSQSPFTAAQPASPARSMSISSVTTQELHASLGDHIADARAANNQTPQISSIPSLTAANPAGSAAGLPMFTPPQTPGSSMAGAALAPTSHHHSTGSTGHAGVKREGEGVMQPAAPQEKRRRIQPTLISGGEGITSAAPSTAQESPTTATPDNGAVPQDGRKA